MADDDRSTRAAVRELVDRETRAWDERDADALVDLFHPDMVWPWPPTAFDHDPTTWELELGRFDRERWRDAWQTLFDTHELVHNRRSVEALKVSEAGDGAFAVVDIDTCWRHRETGERQRWNGRTTKIYALVDGEWKMTAHVGTLRFDDAGNPVTEPDA